MSGKGKNFVEYHWQIGYNLFIGIGELPREDTLKGDCCIFIEVGNPKKIFLQSNSNVEDYIIKKDAVANLSNEAKDVINMIFKGPEDFLKEISTPKYNCVSKNLLIKKLISIGWERNKIKKVFDELKNFVSTFE